jgi:Uma2 family endonuclease
MSKPLIRPEFYTYADYYSWPDVIRGELIEGEFYDMTPAPSPAHQRITGNLHAQMVSFFRGKRCRPFIAPFDVRLPKPGDEDGMERNVVQPDITVICDRTKIDERGCRGAPDWIIEILSPGTRDKDQTLKRDLYERSGVPLYWMVSPRERSFTCLRLDLAGRYGPPSTHEGKGQYIVAEYPGLTVDWDWVFESD